MPPELHNRNNEKLYAYGESVRGGRLFAEEKDVDSDTIKDIRDSCFVVETIACDTDRQGYRYDYLVKYRSCMTPLGSLEDGVPPILGGMKWKSV